MISGPYNRNGIVDAEVRANRGAARPDAILDVPRNRTIFRHFSFNYVSGVDAALGVLPGENSLRLVSCIDCFRQMPRPALTSPPDDIACFPVIASHYSHRSEEHTSELQSLMRISYPV